MVVILLIVVPVNLHVVKTELHAGVVGVLNAKAPLRQVNIRVEVVAVIEQVSGLLVVPLLTQRHAPVLQVVGKHVAKRVGGE